MRAADVDLASLPDDSAALRALLIAVMAERDALAERNERLRHLLEKLCQSACNWGSVAECVLVQLS
jgi:hypothetical protein